MIFDNSTSSICFDDVLLVPKKSNIASRMNIDISSILGNPKNQEAWLYLNTPLILAPMDSISSTKMIRSVINRGGVAFIHRWQPLEKRLKQLKELSDTDKNLGFAIGINEIKDIDFINNILSFNIKVLLIDTAFAHTDLCIEAVKNLRLLIPKYIHIMVGNISSYEAYKDLIDSGADSVRVGIGGGAACNTRFATGFGVPVLSSIMDIYKNIDQDQVNGIVSDGGVKQTGDIVKAFAAGASAVMMGKMFAGHVECENNSFRGIASLSLQMDTLENKPEVASSLHIEGVEGTIDQNGSVEDTLNQMINNIKSGFSYCGSSTLKDFQKNCRFIKVSQQSIQESAPRIK